MKAAKKVQRFLSIFLACIMILNVPMSALAYDDIQEVYAVEDMEIAAEEIALDEDAAFTDEAMDETVEEDVFLDAEEEAWDDSLQESTANEQDTLQADDLTETAQESVSDETALPNEESSNLIESIEVLSAEEAEALELLADEVEEEESTSAADPAEMTVTIANAGTLVLKRQEVTVTDRNKDGKLDVDEALYAAHEAAYTGGAAAGYASQETQWGLSIAKLWGDESGCYGYWVNDSSCSSLSDEVEMNDKVVAFVYQDKTNWSDAYAKFGADEYAAAAGAALKVTVQKDGYDDNWNHVFSAYDNAVLTAYDSSFAPLSSDAYTVDGYNVTFNETGTYYLVASGSEETILVPAITKVKVGVAVTGITLNKTEAAITEDNSTWLKATLEPENAQADVTWSSSDETVATVSGSGTVTVTGVSAGEAVITASVGSVSAECKITVNPHPLLADLKLYRSYSSWNSGEEAFVMTPEFDGKTHTGYSVTVPDYLSNLYAVSSISQETLDSGYSDWIYFSNNWGGWSGSMPSGGIAAKEAYFSKGYVDVYFGTDSAGKYQVTVDQYTTLSGLTIDGVVDRTFHRDTETYHAYVDSTAEGVKITPTAYKNTYTVKVNGTEVTSGEAYTLPYTWDENGKMNVSIEVSSEGKNTSVYTVELEKQPLDDAPFIMTQPVEADYIVGDTTKELYVEASAGGEMSYQWYSNSTDSNEGGTAVEGATEAKFAPSSETIGTVYYYCVITNTEKTEGNTTASAAARVTVDPDPTPVAVIKNPGEEMPEDEYEYAWDKGYLYKVGDEAAALTVEAESAAEGGTWSYQWLSPTRAYNIMGWSGLSDDTKSNTYTPSTGLAKASTKGAFYGCKVTYTFKGKSYTVWATTGDKYTEGEGESAETYDVNGVYVFVKTDSAAVPEFTSQPASASYMVGDRATNLTAYATRADGGTLTYQWYVNDTESTEGAAAIEKATSGWYTIGTVSEAGTKYYFCEVTNTVQGYTASTVSNIAKIEVKEVEGNIDELLSGSGTAEDPYQIIDAQDYQDVYDLVAQGVSFEGLYLKQTNDITLPEGWKPIGVTRDGTNNIQSGSNLYAFSGILDGNGKTITIPEGGLPLLGYVKGAQVSNLNIYGKKIAGYGLVNNFEGVGLSGSAIIIDNVTLKSGSSTLKSGLIGANITTNGYAGCSAGFTATIRNCTIESGVMIGYNKDQSHIGSIAGRMQGTVENCVSNATVYGKNYVGGIIGTRDNAMGTCTVTGCTFGGKVEASGQHAGGIAGGGYNGSSAPNGVKISINNCTVTGKITGTDKVGGILGADSYVAQSWGAYDFKNNSFTGKVSASEGTYVGGIIGFYDSLNKCDQVSGNYYSADCGAEKGIGFVQYVDTNNTAHETESGATYFSTENGTEECPTVAGCGWQTGHNRTDDPLGADADALATSKENADPIVMSLTVSGTYKTNYYMGQEIDLTGMLFTAKWSDDSETNPTAEEVTVTGFDTTKRGSQEVTLTYQGASVTVTVTVLKGAKVTFSLQGDALHDSEEDGMIHTLAAENLEVWVPETIYYVDTNATIYDVMLEAAEEYGFVIGADEKTQYGTYIRSITMNDVTLAEFDNGPRSGWMYTVNGVHPDVGVAARYVDDGDVIIFHYSDDYTEEESLLYDKAQAGEVTEAVTALPAADKLTIADKAVVEKARDAYEALTDEQKALVSDETLKQLEAAEARIAELEKAGSEEPETPQEHVHKWDAGTVTKAATCTAEGVKTFKCACGETKTETIAKTAHSYGEWTTVSEANVLNKEVQKHTCKVCGVSETQEVGEVLPWVLELPGKLKSIKMKKGDKENFSVKLAAGDSVTSVKSSKTKYVKASLNKKTGKITLKALKTGTSKLTIKLASGGKKTYTVKVVKGTVKTTSISVSNVTNKTVTVKKGKTFKLKTVLKPFTSTQKVTFKSSDKKIATVSANGKIKGIRKGTAKITVKSGSKKVTIKVKVK